MEEASGDRLRTHPEFKLPRIDGLPFHACREGAHPGANARTVLSCPDGKHGRAHSGREHDKYNPALAFLLDSIIFAKILSSCVGVEPLMKIPSVRVPPGMTMIRPLLPTLDSVVRQAVTL